MYHNRHRTTQSHNPRLCRNRVPVREGNLPVAHACQREWDPVREACFLYPTPVQKQGSRTGRELSRCPRLPTGMGSRIGSMLRVPHACAETGCPFGKTLPVPHACQQEWFLYGKHASRTPSLCKNRLPAREKATLPYPTLANGNGFPHHQRNIQFLAHIAFTRPA